MPTTVTVGGLSYSVPLYNETGWAQGQGNLSQYLIALAAQVASTPVFMQFTAVSATPTTIVSGHTYLVTTSSLAITLNVPTPAANAWFIVKDKTGNSGTNMITIHRAGSELIDGQASDATLAAPYGSWMFFSDGTDWYSVFTV